MLELTSSRKHKVQLSDYPFEEDIACRMLMADFTPLDIEILEEIIYSSLKIPLKKLEKNFEPTPSFFESLGKFSSIGLLSLEKECILIDKEKRKYFEFEMSRFDPDFKPDMEFVQGLLRKVPIHVLPSWYSIPRTSSHIFQSILEKTLLTPHLFERHIQELQLPKPFYKEVIQEVFAKEDLKISSSDLISSYNLSRRDFEEMMLYLEFHFACCVVFEKEDDHWVEMVRPFYEWSEYLKFFSSTEPEKIVGNEISSKEEDFAFLEKMSLCLKKVEKTPTFKTDPLEKPLEWLLSFSLLKEKKEGLVPSSQASSWLEFSMEEKSSYLYRRFSESAFSASFDERRLKEAEKSLKRINHGKWVFFEDFLKSPLVPLSEDSVIELKKKGKHWSYQLPTYHPEDLELIRFTVFDWLHPLGIVKISTYQDQPVIALTEFGQFFFEE